MHNKNTFLDGLFTIKCVCSIVACDNVCGNEYKCQETSNSCCF